ncbi:hypothetical protein [Sandarakinorhabdus limnophila]|uniref:hypothetical protein n=1 Tax=Sandarakinorhabdus limnophila TaxID=210512 RepID=UPI003137BA5A
MTHSELKSAILAAKGIFTELIDLMISDHWPVEIITEAGLLALFTVKSSDAHHPAEIVSWLRDAADAAEDCIIERVTEDD